MIATSSNNKRARRKRWGIDLTKLKLVRPWKIAIIIALTIVIALWVIFIYRDSQTNAQTGRITSNQVPFPKELPDIIFWGIVTIVAFVGSLFSNKK